MIGEAGDLDDLDAMFASVGVGDDDADLAALFAGVEDRVPDGAFDGLKNAEDFEALLREEWSLPALDVGREVGRMDALQRGDRPSHDDDPFASDDYSDEQWALVIALKRPCLEAAMAEIAPAKRAAAIRWIFEVGSKDGNGLSFEQVCRALGARGFVIQALIQHFWCLRGVHLPEGLPYLSRPLAQPLESEAILAAMEPGLRLAHVAWRFPSIDEGDLMARCDAGSGAALAEYTKALDWLCEYGTLTRRFGRVYFTSRHPDRRHRPNASQGKVRGVSWSQSFVGDVDE